MPTKSREPCTLCEAPTFGPICETCKTNTTVAAALAELKSAMDDLDVIREQEKAAKRKRAAAEAVILYQSEVQELDKFSSPNTPISVTISDKHIVGYDPERWDELLKWAVDTNNGHIVQRRITDSRVWQLASEGVELPDGLELDTVRIVRPRRTG